MSKPLFMFFLISSVHASNFHHNDFTAKAYSSFSFDTGASPQLFLEENDPIKNYLKELQQNLEAEEKRQKNHLMMMQQNAQGSVENKRQNNYIMEASSPLFMPSNNPSPPSFTLQLPSKEKLLQDMNLMPLHEATLLYKCSIEELKQHCRTLGIKKWNYKKRKIQERPSTIQGFYEFELVRK